MNRLEPRGPDADDGRHIFLIARYRRTSGADLTASTPSAAPVAVMATAATYPSVRITFLLIFSGSTIRDIGVFHSAAGGAPALMAAPGSWTGLRQASYLAAVLDGGGR